MVDIQRQIICNKALKQFDGNSAVSSLLVEIGPDAVTVRTIIAKPEEPMPGLDGITHLIGRDFGMVNTVSLTVVKIDKEISREEVDRISAFSRQEALKYLEGNSHTGDNVVQRIRFSGRKFLDAIKSQCDRIDYLNSQIDTCYNKLAKLKGILCGHIGLAQDDMLADDMVFKDHFVQKLYDKFFRLLSHIRKLKAIRYRIYERIRHTKKSWFGFLSNCERLLAKHFNAAIVREDLNHGDGESLPRVQGEDLQQDDQQRLPRSVHKKGFGQVQVGWYPGIARPKLLHLHCLYVPFPDRCFHAVGRNIPVSKVRFRG